MLIVDSNEPLDIMMSICAVVPSKMVEQRRLVTADVSMTDKCGCRVGIERKTALDLLSSIADGRLKSQADRLINEFEYPVVVLEGSMSVSPDGKVFASGRDSGFYYSAVQMLLWSLQMRGISLMYVSGKPEFAAFVSALHNRCMNKKKCVRGSNGQSA